MKKANHSYIERIKTILKGSRYLTQALDDHIKMQILRALMTVFSPLMTVSVVICS